MKIPQIGYKSLGKTYSFVGGAKQLNNSNGNQLYGKYLHKQQKIANECDDENTM
jgi:hypothetical protein